MTSENRIYAFFLLLAILYWNPLTYSLLYSSISQSEPGIMHLICWAAFLGLSGAMVLLRMGKLGSFFKDLGLYFSYFTILFVVLGLANRAMTPSEEPKPWDKFIFEPNSSARYVTSEFKFMAYINSLGLRDREVSRDKGDKFRILCVGDSWTYGWGVEAEYNWPRQLEAFFHSKGLEHIEVVNGGQGGQYTSVYKDYLEKLVPYLKPDLVLVGVLQLDDLAQIFEEQNPVFKPEIKPPFTQTIVPDMKSFLKANLGNIIKLVKKDESRPYDVHAVWKSSCNQRVKQFNHLQKVRFLTLDEEVQNMFLEGDLNPGLLSYYIDFPDRVLIFNDPEHHATQYSLSVMKKDFDEMKSVCDENGCSLMFINMPSNYFTGHQVIRTPSDNLNSYFEQHNCIDSMYQSVAISAGITYMELTDHFLSLQDKEGYFFQYDGHPNEKGYLEIAHFIGKTLIERNMVTRQNIVVNQTGFEE